MATLGGLVLAVPAAVPAEATPKPHDQEWYFDSLSIQEKAWPYTKGKGVTVAVLDTGVQADLPEFRGGVVLPGKDFQEPGDGRTDQDEHTGHGTGMASLIAGQGGGQSGIVGVAPEAKILPLRGGIAGDPAPLAIRYAADHGAKVLNISQGAAGGDEHPCWTELQDAIIYAVQKDVVVLVAAGNSGDRGNPVEYPAACAGVVAVGAYDHNGEAWVQTARQPYVTIAGPGAQVSSLGKDGRLYQYGDGTSQATAVDSGATALLRARFPNESAKQIVQRIINTTTDLGPPGRDDWSGYGALSLRKAMTATVPADAPNPVYDKLDKTIAELAAKRSAEAAEDKAIADAAAKKSSSGPSLLLVVGIVLAALVLLVVLAVVIFVAARRRRPAGREPAFPAAPDPDRYPPPDPGAGG